MNHDPEAPACPQIFLPTCTVVICTRNRPQQLDQCLEAVSRLAYPRFDVLVVDSAPADDRARQVALRRGVRYLIEPEIGSSWARNRGARACDTEIVAYLDDDAVPEPGWLSGLASEFHDPVVMAVAGRTVALNAESEAGGPGDLLAVTRLGDPEGRVVDQQTPYWFEIANFGGIGNGMNMAFRRRAFELWPGFDERIGPGKPLDSWEENLAFFSLIQRGWRVAYTRHAVVSHPIPSTWQSLRQRYLRQTASAAGYMTLLFLEHAGHRRAVVKYLVEALRGTPRAWRGPLPPAHPRIAPRWRVLLACLRGPFLYLRSRLTHRRPHHGP